MRSNGGILATSAATKSGKRISGKDAWYPPAKRDRFIIQQLVGKYLLNRETMEEDLIEFVEAADAAAKRWLELK